MSLLLLFNQHQTAEVEVSPAGIMADYSQVRRKLIYGRAVFVARPGSIDAAGRVNDDELALEAFLTLP